MTVAIPPRRPDCHGCWRSASECICGPSDKAVLDAIGLFDAMGESRHSQVRLTTDGERWRVEVQQRSWLLLGAKRWSPVEFGITKKRPFTFSEQQARQRYDEVVAEERRRFLTRRQGWRVVEHAPQCLTDLPSPSGFACDCSPLPGDPEKNP